VSACGCVDRYRVPGCSGVGDGRRGGIPLVVLRWGRPTWRVGVGFGMKSPERDDRLIEVSVWIFMVGVPVSVPFGMSEKGVATPDCQSMLLESIPEFWIWREVPTSLSPRG
jgi:hypothetical protein